MRLAIGEKQPSASLGDIEISLPLKNWIAKRKKRGKGKF